MEINSGDELPLKILCEQKDLTLLNMIIMKKQLRKLGHLLQIDIDCVLRIVLISSLQYEKYND